MYFPLAVTAGFWADGVQIYVNGSVPFALKFCPLKTPVPTAMPEELNTCTSTLAFESAAPVSLIETEIVEDPLCAIVVGLAIAVAVNVGVPALIV